MFKDRTAAGHLLAEKLSSYKNAPGLVLAVPRGGVPVAYCIARELGFPMDIILVKKIGHPNNKEYAIGAASLTDYVVTPHPDVSASYIEEEVARIRTRLTIMRQKFLGDREPADISGKTVIVVDDGAATGHTLLSTIDVIKKGKPAKIIVAVPVASRPAARLLAGAADEVVTCLTPDYFYGVGAYYENFKQVSDDEVAFYLDKFNRLSKAG
ncbi:MAG: phosphoribosyltransferase [Mucilaginibacter sp.]